MRGRFLAVVLLAAGLLDSFLTVELKKEIPIDLEAQIEAASVGLDGYEETPEAEEEKEDGEESGPDGSRAPALIPGREAGEEQTLRVRGKQIFFQNMKLAGIGDLRRKLTEGKGGRLDLVEDYADYRTYREVLALLEELEVPFEESVLD